jgi:hypothetical protein
MQITINVWLDGKGISACKLGVLRDLSIDYTIGDLKQALIQRSLFLPDGKGKMTKELLAWYHVVYLPMESDPGEPDLIFDQDAKMIRDYLPLLSLPMITVCLIEKSDS